MKIYFYRILLHFSSHTRLATERFVSNTKLDETVLSFSRGFYSSLKSPVKTRKLQPQTRQKSLQLGILGDLSAALFGVSAIYT